MCTWSSSSYSDDGRRSRKCGNKHLTEFRKERLRRPPRNYVCTCIFVSTFHSLNFTLGDQVADIECYQTNHGQAMTLKMLKTQTMVQLAWNVYSACTKLLIFFILDIKLLWPFLRFKMVKIVSLISLFFTLQLCARCQDLAWDRSVCGSPLQSLLCKQKPQTHNFSKCYSFS